MSDTGAAGPDARPRAFGPTALATPANALTLARLVAAPLFAVVLAHVGPSWWMWAAWTVLACSDGLDGHIARWHGTTRSGAFLDPLADKFLVIGALAALVARGAFGVVPLAVIAARELAMSCYRSLAARRGISIPARRLAKAKTLVQDVAIGFAILPWLGTQHPAVAQDALWVAVVLTVLSGVQYVADGRRVASAQGAPEPKPRHERVG